VILRPGGPIMGGRPAGCALTCYLLPLMIRSTLANLFTAAGLAAGLMGGATAFVAVVALAHPCADLASQTCRNQTRAEVACLMVGLSTVAAGGLMLGAAGVASTARRPV
jgi:hypothetical protein